MHDDERWARERKLRRAAHRRGYVLTRSRRRDRYALDWGLYRLAPADNVPAETVGPSFCLTFEDVEAILAAGGPTAPGDGPQRALARL